MTTIGKKGLGQRHLFVPINQSPKELRERELAQAKREVEPPDASMRRARTNVANRQSIGSTLFSMSGNSKGKDR